MLGLIPARARTTHKAIRAVILFITLLAVLTGLGGCASNGKDLDESQAFWSRVFSKETYQLYKPPIIQGNNDIVEERKVRRVKIGMTPAQIKFLIGEPVLHGIFTRDRWDYVYYKIPTKGPRVSRKLILFFENERLARICQDERCRSKDKPYNNKKRKVTHRPPSLQ